VLQKRGEEATDVGLDAEGGGVGKGGPGDLRIEVHVDEALRRRQVAIPKRRRLPQTGAEHQHPTRFLMHHVIGDRFVTAEPRDPEEVRVMLGDDSLAARRAENLRPRTVDQLLDQLCRLAGTETHPDRERTLGETLRTGGGLRRRDRRGGHPHPRPPARQIHPLRLDPHRQADVRDEPSGPRKPETQPPRHFRELGRTLHAHREVEDRTVGVEHVLGHGVGARLLRRPPSPLRRAGGTADHNDLRAIPARRRDPGQAVEGSRTRGGEDQRWLAAGEVGLRRRESSSGFVPEVVQLDGIAFRQRIEEERDGSSAYPEGALDPQLRQMLDQGAHHGRFGLDPQLLLRHERNLLLSQIVHTRLPFRGRSGSSASLPTGRSKTLLWVSRICGWIHAFRTLSLEICNPWTGVAPLRLRSRSDDQGAGSTFRAPHLPPCPALRATGPDQGVGPWNRPTSR